jgi:hypothetical protein
MLQLLKKYPRYASQNPSKKAETATQNQQKTRAAFGLPLNHGAASAS